MNTQASRDVRPTAGNEPGFLDRILRPPSYGWQDANGALIVPTKGQVIREALSRTNVFASSKRWVAFAGWFWVLCLSPFVVLFFFKYFTWWGLAAGFAYGMVMMGTHGTVWFHRYSTHRAYTFRNAFWRELTRQLVIKVLPEETYVVSHHVHHAKSDQPGDPYNARGGFLYCFLADANHQPIEPNLSEVDYARVAGLLAHTGVRCNSYAEYQRWGSIANPYRTFAVAALNWAVWYAIFYAIGGAHLAVAIFGGACVWALGVRTFNYEGHGRGDDKRRDGVDFNRNDLSINQMWPGFVSGEWHNNHHMFPNSARAGFLPYQLDLAWVYISFLHRIGAVSSYNDSRPAFYDKFVAAPEVEAVN
ncbi:MAG TPA: fatty acid desaturase [Vicinamibacterales bacterium]|nr:fatty acid desaturase [Vicinamibacterales bacterium]